MNLNKTPWNLFFILVFLSLGLSTACSDHKLRAKNPIFNPSKIKPNDKTKDADKDKDKTPPPIIGEEISTPDSGLNQDGDESAGSSPEVQPPAGEAEPLPVEEVTGSEQDQRAIELAVELVLSEDGAASSKEEVRASFDPIVSNQILGTSLVRIETSAGIYEINVDSALLQETQDAEGQVLQLVDPIVATPSALDTTARVQSSYFRYSNPQQVTDEGARSIENLSATVQCLKEDCSEVLLVVTVLIEQPLRAAYLFSLDTNSLKMNLLGSSLGEKYKAFEDEEIQNLIHESQVEEAQRESEDETAVEEETPAEETPVEEAGSEAAAEQPEEAYTEQRTKDDAIVDIQKPQESEAKAYIEQRTKDDAIVDTAKPQGEQAQPQTAEGSENAPQTAEGLENP